VNVVRKQIVIHVGTHKTGTTTIQDFLRANRRWFRTEGYLYIGSPLLFKMFKNRSYNSDLVSECKKTFAVKTTAFNRNKKFFISCENLSGDPWDGYKNSDIIAEMLRDIFPNFDVKIVLYLRRQDLFIESLYVQYIQQGGVLSFDEYYNNVSVGVDFNWLNLVEGFSKIFGKSALTIRVFETENMISHDLITDFCSTLNIIPHIEERSAKNVSYARDILEYARLSNRHLGSSAKKSLRRQLQALAVGYDSKKYSYLSEEKRKDLIERYAHSNKELFSEYNLQADSFSTILPKYEEYLGLNMARVVQISTLLNAYAAIDNRHTSLLSRAVKGTSGLLVNSYIKLRCWIKNTIKALLFRVVKCSED
jgi:hypothetical protein